METKNPNITIELISDEEGTLSDFEWQDDSNAQVHEMSNKPTREFARRNQTPPEKSDDHDNVCVSRSQKTNPHILLVATATEIVHCHRGKNHDIVSFVSPTNIQLLYAQKRASSQNTKNITSDKPIDPLFTNKVDKSQTRCEIASLDYVLPPPNSYVESLSVLPEGDTHPFATASAGDMDYPEQRNVYGAQINHSTIESCVVRRLCRPALVRY